MNRKDFVVPSCNISNIMATVVTRKPTRRAKLFPDGNGYQNINNYID